MEGVASSVVRFSETVKNSVISIPKIEKLMDLCTMMIISDTFKQRPHIQTG